MDALDNGRSFRVLTLEDDYTQECWALGVGTLLLRELDRIEEYRGCPVMIVSDNGIEMAPNAILAWQERKSVLRHFITPGGP
ncbi:hypothetical protein KUA02_08245 [Komagataeibacter pomaceti]|nr:hypothetical protein [Novacetimonas pomaceti]